LNFCKYAGISKRTDHILSISTKIDLATLVVVFAFADVLRSLNG